eukprot:4714169-Prorocentrum_lima.AAC.1
MTSIEGVKNAIEEIEKALHSMLMLWFCILCTEGSTWQYVRMGNYRRRNDVEAIRRVSDL